VKFTNIQVLRFAAAGGILLLHLGVFAHALLGLTGPVADALAAPVYWAGVPVFFAVSGFVLTHSLQTTPVRQFLLLRAVRVFPPYWVAAVVVAVATGINVGARPFVRGLLLLPVGPGKAAYLIGVEWSLVYEVFFYVALGLLALAGRRAVPAGCAVWLGMCLVRMVVAPTAALVQFPTWQTVALSAVNLPFLFGVFAYHLRHRAGPLRLWAPVAVPPLFVGAALAPTYDVALLMLGLGSGLLVAWAATTRQVAADHPLVRYGDFSYGVFLVHVPVLRLVLGMGWPATGTTAATAGLVALAVGLAYGWAETAAYRRVRRWLVRPRRQAAATADAVKRAA